MAEGLVNSEPHRGWIAAPVSAEDLRDLTRTRIEIENLCLSWSIEAGDVEWESRVIAAAHRVSRAFRKHPAGSPPDLAWATAHDEFHYALVSACQSPRLLQIRQQLYEQSERYRKLELVRRPSSRDPDAEHKRIMQATLARDASKATRLMREHLQLTADNLLAAMVQSQKSAVAPKKRATTAGRRRRAAAISVPA